MDYTRKALAQASQATRVYVDSDTGDIVAVCVCCGAEDRQESS